MELDAERFVAVELGNATYCLFDIKVFYELQDYFYLNILELQEKNFRFNFVTIVSYFINYIIDHALNNDNTKYILPTLPVRSLG